MADITDNLTLYLPFDESNGSTKAYDYSSGRHDGTVDNATFKQGTVGNCVHFDGNGAVDIPSNMVNFSGDFTISAYVRGDNTEGESNPKLFGWLIAYPGVDQYLEKWFNINPGVWTQLVLVKVGSYLRFYVNGALIDTKTVLSGTITGITLAQDYYGGKLYGKGDLDEVKFYNIALTQDQIINSSNSSSYLEYYLDGVDFKDYNVKVSDSNGIVDGLKIKTPFTVNWDSEHGEIVDLTRPRYEAREITLDCFITAKGKVDFVNKVNNFLQQFRTAGSHRLTIDINPNKPLVYEVYLTDGAPIKKRWDDDLMVGTFTIKLREPEPVKRVLKHIALNGTMEVTITLTSTKLYNIHWGDGSHDYDIGGDGKAVTVKHTYTAAGNYFPIITGIIEDIKDFSTNAIVVWNIL